MMNQARRRWLLQGQDETVTQNTGDTGDTGDGTSQSALLTRDERAFDASLPVPGLRMLLGTGGGQTGDTPASTAAACAVSPPAVPGLTASCPQLSPVQLSQPGTGDGPQRGAVPGMQAPPVTQSALRVPGVPSPVRHGLLSRDITRRVVAPVPAPDTPIRACACVHPVRCLTRVDGAPLFVCLRCHVDPATSGIAR